MIFDDEILPILILNYLDKEITAIIDIGTRSNLISTQLANKLGFKKSTQGEIEALQLLKEFLAKILGKVNTVVKTNGKLLALSLIIVQETFDYIILRSEELNQL